MSRLGHELRTANEPHREEKCLNTPATAPGSQNPPWQDDSTPLVTTLAAVEPDRSPDIFADLSSPRRCAGESALIAMAISHLCGS
jgi:hypothetical protein